MSMIKSQKIREKTSTDNMKPVKKSNIAKLSYSIVNEAGDIEVKFLFFHKKRLTFQVCIYPSFIESYIYTYIDKIFNRTYQKRTNTTNKIFRIYKIMYQLDKKRNLSAEVLCKNSTHEPFTVVIDPDTMNRMMENFMDAVLNGQPFSGYLLA